MGRNCRALSQPSALERARSRRPSAVALRLSPMDAAYEKPTPEFLLLADSVGAGRDDSRLADIVLSLHKKMQSHARPDLWAKKQIALPW